MGVWVCGCGEAGIMAPRFISDVLYYFLCDARTQTSHIPFQLPTTKVFNSEGVGVFDHDSATARGIFEEESARYVELTLERPSGAFVMSFWAKPC